MEKQNKRPDVKLQEGDVEAAIWFGHEPTRANPGGLQAHIRLDRCAVIGGRRCLRTTFRPQDLRELHRLLERVKVELECHAEHVARMGPLLRARQREQSRSEAIAHGRA